MLVSEMVEWLRMRVQGWCDGLGWTYSAGRQGAEGAAGGTAALCVDGSDDGGEEGECGDLHGCGRGALYWECIKECGFLELGNDLV